VGGTVYNNHTLESLKEMGLDSQRVKKFASKLHVHYVNCAAKLAYTRRALSSIIIDSHQERDGFRSSLQPSWSPLIFSFGGGVLRYPELLFLNCCGE
jgi:seryl-tRNA synthetase